MMGVKKSLNKPYTERLMFTDTSVPATVLTPFVQSRNSFAVSENMDY